MADLKNKTAASGGEELVDYIAPRLGPKEQDIFVGVNGETVRIRRGAHVRIKRKFYDVLMNAQDQEEAAMRAIENAQRQSSRPLAQF